MGITKLSARFILGRSKSSPPLGRVLTLGRQNFILSTSSAIDLLKSHAMWPPAIPETRLRNSLNQLGCFVDDWLLAAGATSVEAMDHSNFEGATVIHNLNEPLAPALHGQFDTVIDAGTLEHIFNVPLALSTYLQLLKPGGRLVLVTVANNCCGHGFYQFSPEFFFRVFSEENGCRLEALQMAEDQIVVPRIGKFQPVVNLPGRVYTVTDPNSIGQRVELMNRRQTTIMVDVIKTRECPLFSKPPQQSDYAAAWTQAEAPTETVRSSVRDWLVRSFKPSTLREVCFRFLPWVIGPIVRLLPAGYFGNYRFSNRRFYTRVD